MRTIKKYSNRRLYDTQASSYINLEALAELIRLGEVVQVQDAKTGEDLTHTVLLQVILETQGLGDLFPSGFLHRIIRYSQAAGAQKAVLQQMGVGMQMLDAQMGRFESQFGWMAGMAPGARKGAAATSAPAAAEPPPEPEEDDASEEHAPVPDAPGRASEEGDELSALRARLAALESRLKD